jgi:hypothetical protein
MYRPADCVDEARSAWKTSWRQTFDGVSIRSTRTLTHTHMHMHTHNTPSDSVTHTKIPSACQNIVAFFHAALHAKLSTSNND